MTQTSVRWIASGLVILLMSLTPEAAKRPSISVSPNGATLQSGQTQQFTATILRSSGTPVWSATGGTITTTGLYTAGSVAGSFTVRATISGTTISSATTVTITVPAPVAEICGNGIDDDLDGLIDEGCSSSPPPACADGLDNDGDGKIDLADPGCLSATDTSETDPAPVPPGVQIAPGQSIQVAIDANPSGTTFTLLAGTHRLTAAIKPKSGDTLVGVDGAVVSGARVLTTFSQINGYWAATGQPQENATSAFGGSPSCQPAYPRCARPEDLFFDSMPLRHVDALSKVGPGSYYFDYPTDTIYFADDPTGHFIETSAAPLAIYGNGQTNVTLRHFVVEKFASPAQKGAVWADGAHGWTIDDVTFRQNHGTALTFTSSADCRIVNSRFNDNGQIGIGTYDTDRVVVDNNELARNNYAGYDPLWEAGGAKFTWSRDMTVSRNFAHHNHGDGLWTDTDNIRAVYDANRASDNDGNGIFHEISYDAIIRNNTAERNGKHGIVVDSSPNAEAYGNVCRDNVRPQQIAGRQNYVGKIGRYGALELTNLWVHDNQIAGGGAGILPQGPASNDGSYYTSKNNHFDFNTYDLSTAVAAPFYWQFGNRNDQQWRAYGQDVTGSITP